MNLDSVDEEVRLYMMGRDHEEKRKARAIETRDKHPVFETIKKLRKSVTGKGPRLPHADLLHLTRWLADLAKYAWEEPKVSNPFTTNIDAFDQFRELAEEASSNATKSLALAVATQVVVSEHWVEALKWEQAEREKNS